MPDLQLLLEAERRGILPPEKAGLLTEARRRGLVPALDAQQPIDTPERRALQSQVTRDLAAADEAGKKLETAETAAKFFRPAARVVTDLADGALALPRVVVNRLTADPLEPIYGDQALPAVNIPSIQSLGSDNGASLEPRDEAERLQTAITRSVGGTLLGIGAGGSLSRAPGAIGQLGRNLAANPGLQIAGAVTAPASSEIARRAGAGPIGQLAAGVAGAAAPSLLLAGGQALTRGVLRGGESGRQQVQDNIDTFARAGTTPTVGQATERRPLQAAEQALAQVPGGAGPIIRKGEALAEELSNKVDDTATALAGRTSAEQAGRKITAGIEGAGGFVERTKATQEALYNNLDQQIPPSTPTSVANTQTALRDLTKVDPGAARTTSSLVNPKIKQIAEDLAVDAQTGTVPYSALKQLRTRIGEQLDETLTADVPQKQLRRLYAALSEDLKDAATQAGPAAEKAWQRANNYTRARADRLDMLEEVLSRQGGSEAVFKAATSGTAEGATRLRAVLQSLDDDGQKAVTATVLRRLGRATAGQQDELAEKFSTETFLTNFAKLSNEAKRALFDRYGPGFREDIDAIAKVSANLRQGSKVFRNPSGTSQAITLKQTVGGAILAVLGGRFDVAAGIAAGVGGANLSARLMTNPNFVRFLAQSTKLPPSAYTSQINELAQLAQDTGDTDLAEAADYLQNNPPTPEVKRGDKKRDLVQERSTPLPIGSNPMAGLAQLPSNNADPDARAETKRALLKLLARESQGYR